MGGNGLALIDARTHKVAARVALPKQPSDVVFDRRSAWALLPTQQRVVQVRLDRPAVLRRVKLPFPAGGIALGGGALFATEQGGGPGVVRMSTSTGKITARWTVPTRGALVGPERDRRRGRDRSGSRVARRWCASTLAAAACSTASHCR